MTISTNEISVAVEGHRFGEAASFSYPAIITYSLASNSQSNQFELRYNGTNLTESTLVGSSQNINTGDTIANIGANINLGSFFNGNYGEIIIFNRQLKTSEIEEVEKYLSQKWKININ